MASTIGGGKTAIARVVLDMAEARTALWPAVKGAAAATLVSVTISDGYATFVKAQGSSMRPTFEPELGDSALVEGRRYDFSHGDVVVLC